MEAAVDGWMLQVECHKDQCLAHLLFCMSNCQWYNWWPQKYTRDDSKLYRIIKTPKDVEILQEDLQFIPYQSGLVFGY